MQAVWIRACLGLDQYLDPKPLFDRSTGCGESSCQLCAFNPSRLCVRNLRPKYLIEDHLRAKCNAPLRVELLDEGNTCYSQGLPAGVQLEVRSGLRTLAHLGAHMVCITNCWGSMSSTCRLIRLSALGELRKDWLLRCDCITQTGCMPCNAWNTLDGDVMCMFQSQTLIRG